MAGQDRSLPPRPKTSPQRRLGGLAPCPHHSRAGGVGRGGGRGRAGQTDWEGRTARGRHAGWPRIWNGRPLKFPTTLLIIITYHNVLHSEAPRPLSNLGCCGDRGPRPASCARRRRLPCGRPHTTVEGQWCRPPDLMPAPAPARGQPPGLGAGRRGDGAFPPPPPPIAAAPKQGRGIVAGR